MNEHRFIQKLTDTAEALRLSDTARGRIRTHLLEHMAARAPSAEGARQHFVSSVFQYVAFPSPFSLEFFHRRIVAPALIAILILTGTGFTAYAAESALPGEFLYGVKVNVNEELYNTFLFSNAARLEWLSERAARRLEEANALAVAGTLDTKKTAQVLKTLAMHVNEATALAAQVAKTDPATALEASSELEATLESEGNVMARLAVEGMAPDTTREVAQTAAVQARGVSEVRAAAEVAVLGNEDALDTAHTAAPVMEIPMQTPEISPGAEAQEAPDTTITDSRTEAFGRIAEKTDTLIHEVEDTLAGSSAAGTDFTARGDAFIEEAKRLYVLGEEKRESGNYRGAIEAIRKSYATAVQARALLSAQLLLSVNILPDSVAQTETGRVVPEVASESDVAKANSAAHAALAEPLALFEKNILPPSISSRVIGLIKDSRSLILRAEIQQTLGEHAKAVRFFREAEVNAKRAHELILVTEREGQLTPIETSVTPSVLPSSEIKSPVIPEETPPSLPALDTVRVYHSFDAESGTHTYRGTFVTPTPCFALRADALVAESFPEQISLALATQDSGGICVQVLDEKPFAVEVQAGEGARLMGVSVNGVASKFEVIEEDVDAARLSVPLLLDSAAKPQ